MTEQRHLTEAKYLARNGLMNLATGLLIVGLNIAFVPLMLHSFGTELYGVLAATWMFLANLGWLDLGFSRATAWFVSQDLAVGRADRAVLWTWTAVLSQAFLGLSGALVLCCFAHFIVAHIHVRHADGDLVVLTLRLFAFAVPVDFASRSMTGVLQAGQRFDWVNGINLFNTISTYLVYGLAILSGANFTAVILGLFAMRVLGFFLSCYAASKVLPGLRSLAPILTIPEEFWTHAASMIKYGSWAALAAAIAPLLLYFDQWIISVLSGIASLPLYTIPLNAILRLLILPSSITSTLFPAFTAMRIDDSWEKMQGYFIIANKYILTATIPLLFVLYIWAAEIFRLWLGPGLSTQMTTPFRILLIGIGAGLLAPVSAIFLEAMGRPDVLAKLYLLELPFNIAIVWVMVKNYNIAGAAFSFSIREIVETLVLLVVLHRLFPLSIARFLSATVLRPCLGLIPLGIAAYFMPGVRIGNFFHILATLLVLGVYILLVLLHIFDIRDKQFLQSLYSNR